MKPKPNSSTSPPKPGFWFLFFSISPFSFIRTTFPSIPSGNQLVIFGPSSPSLLTFYPSAKPQAPCILPKKISRHPLPRTFPSCGAWPPTFHSSQGHLNVNYLSHGQRGRACLAQLLVNGSFLLFRLFIFSSSS